MKYQTVSGETLLNGLNNNHVGISEVKQLVITECSA